MNKKKITNFDRYLKSQLKDPKFKAHYEEFGKQLEIAYSMTRLRKHMKISQGDLAKRMGTTQSNIARMEAGNQNVTIGTLGKFAQLMGRELEVKFK